MILMGKRSSMRAAVTTSAESHVWLFSCYRS